MVAVILLQPIGIPSAWIWLLPLVGALATVGACWRELVAAWRIRKVRHLLAAGLIALALFWLGPDAIIGGSGSCNWWNLFCAI